MQKTGFGKAGIRVLRPANFAGLLAGCVVLVSGTAQAGDHGVRVALFADPGSTEGKRRDAIFELLSKADGVTVEKVTSPTVCRDSFEQKFDVVILPGGSGGGEAKALGIAGGKALTNFVKMGKGLVAICAGGYYAVQGWNATTGALDVISADTWDDAHWARGEGFIAVKSLDAGGETSHTMWFENGPIFVPSKAVAGEPAYTPLVKYVSDLAPKGAPHGLMQGRDAVIAARFGKGRVVAFGPHPELSPELNDWLVNAVKWTAAASGADSQGTLPTVESVLERSGKR